MKKIIVTALVIFIGYGLIAQDYKAAIGIRGGVAQGITFKTAVGGNTAFDLIVANLYQGLSLTALYEIHSLDVFGVDNLALFYGFGGQVGFYNSTHYPKYLADYSSRIILGVAGVVGIEYTFDEIPINLSVDIVPSFNLVPGFKYWQRGALSIRYVFK
ncbi:MAG: hypothetical protein PHP52_14280 [Bacteroidales bacterium]|nr:hypothetical protein [Bacteroidales bacterium]MDD4149939.1 hypothetical protein [Bacteroidales bacterium]